MTEMDKKKADELWSSFLKDTKTTTLSKPTTKSDCASVTVQQQPASSVKTCDKTSSDLFARFTDSAGVGQSKQDSKSQQDTQKTLNVKYELEFV